MARMQSAQRKKVKVWCPDRGLNPGPSTCRAEALPLTYQNLCTFRAVLSICYWITDIHVWDVMHLVMTEQPHYRSFISSHFDLSSLISMARMQSAPKEESKSLMCRPGIEPGTFHLPGECSNHWATDTFVLSVQSWAYVTELQTSMYEMWCI